MNWPGPGPSEDGPALAVRGGGKTCPGPSCWPMVSRDTRLSWRGGRPFGPGGPGLNEGGRFGRRLGGRLLLFMAKGVVGDRVSSLGDSVMLTMSCSISLCIIDDADCEGIEGIVSVESIGGDWGGLVTAGAEDDCTMFGRLGTGGGASLEGGGTGEKDPWS
jgi:hypothetical protein